MKASEIGIYDIVDYLLKRDDIDCNMTDDVGRTALMYAVRMGQTDIVS